jgi:hypothetical protein
VSAHGTGAAIGPVDEQVVSLKLLTPAEVCDPSLCVGESLMPTHCMARRVEDCVGESRTPTHCMARRVEDCVRESLTPAYCMACRAGGCVRG